MISRSLFSAALRISLFVRRQMLLDCLLYELPRLIGLDCIEFNGDGTEILCTGITGLGGPCRQIPIPDLLRRYVQGCSACLNVLTPIGGLTRKVNHRAVQK